MGEETDRHGASSEDSGEPRETRALEEILAQDKASLYEDALRCDDVLMFYDDPDAPAHAICHIRNDLGKEGWAVITCYGSSFEGLWYESSDVFESEDQARDRQHDLYSSDESRYEDRMAEEAEEEQEEEAEEPQEDPADGDDGDTDDESAEDAVDDDEDEDGDDEHGDEP